MRHPVVAASRVAVLHCPRVWLAPARGLRDAAKSLQGEQKPKAARSNAIKGV